MILIKGKDFNQSRKEIKENHGKNIIFSSDNDELDRKILEKEKINVLLINQIRRKDKMKQRDSGFNQVMAKIAKKNNITIGINLNEIIDSNGKIKSEILARIRQNVKLCNKNKLNMIFLGAERNTHDLKSLGLVLGMPTWMTKNL